MRVFALPRHFALPMMDTSEAGTQERGMSHKPISDYGIIGDIHTARNLDLALRLREAPPQEELRVGEPGGKKEAS